MWNSQVHRLNSHPKCFRFHQNFHSFQLKESLNNSLWLLDNRMWVLSRKDHRILQGVCRLSSSFCMNPTWLQVRNWSRTNRNHTHSDIPNSHQGLHNKVYTQDLHLEIPRIDKCIPTSYMAHQARFPSHHMFTCWHNLLRISPNPVWNLEQWLLHHYMNCNLYRQSKHFIAIALTQIRQHMS